MINDRDLDRAIDAAAGSMMTREPSGALGYNVMAQVRGGAVRPSPRFVWLMPTAALLVSAAAAAALLYQRPLMMPSVPAAPHFAIAPGPSIEAAPGRAFADPPSVRHMRSVAAVTRSTSQAAAPPTGVSPIAPLGAEPIVVAAIEVPQIETGAPVSIEVLTIERLTIEPLTASND